MKIKIYQIDTFKDKNRVAFESLDKIEKYQGSKNINSKIYDMVYDGNVGCETLEGVFKVFNTSRPINFKGRSLSVSDIVYVEDNKELNGYYYVDRFGFKKVEFNLKANPLEWYKSNRDEFKEYHLLSACYNSVENMLNNEDLDDKVYEIIAGKAYATYLKDENKLGIIEISDFLAENYKNGSLTLDEIQNANIWDVATAVIDDSVFPISKLEIQEDELEM